MIVELQQGKLKILIPGERLTSGQIGQLKYYGFKKLTLSEYISERETSPNYVMRVINYLTEEEFQPILSEEVSRIVKKIYNQIESFNQSFVLARNFKQGILNTIDYKEFNITIDQILKRKLLGHQRKAAYHLYLLKNSANFSVPGSGKTSVVISVFEKLRLEGLVNTLFVIGPPACFTPWRKEFFETLGRQPNCRILAGGDQVLRKLEYYNCGENRGELYLTTFQTLLNDIDDVKKFLKNNNIAAFIVVDEAHYIKQIGGEWAKAVLSISPLAKYHCVLTGTPLPKSFSDLFNLIDFLFSEIHPLDSKLKLNLLSLEKQNDIQSIKSIFKDKVDPLVFRVRKKDLGLIPANFHTPVLIEMNNYEKLLYEAIINKIKDYSITDYLSNIDLVHKLMRGRMIRLRQCASYAKLLSTALVDYEEDLLCENVNLASIIRDYDTFEKPAKLCKLLHMVSEFHEKKLKVVIWSTFIETIRLIKRELTDSGFNCEVIYGDTPTENTSVSDEKTRDQIRDEFVNKDSGLDILIANPAACAESISLHKTCFHAIYYDLSYNCAQYLQSLDRIHRVGGSEINQANYYFLQYSNSIDQDILNNLNQKAQKMYTLIEDEYNIYSLDMFFDEIDDEVEAYHRLFRVENA